MLRFGPIPRSRLRLAAAYLVVIGVILYGAGYGMFGLLMRANWSALESEVETLAGTLHDSLKPLLPAEARPTPELASVLPGLCLVGDPCQSPASLLPRHAVSITDSERFYLRLLDPRGVLIAHSPGSPKARGPSPGPTWSVVEEQAKERFLQYSIHLHRSDAPAQPGTDQKELDWGYLQIGRSLRGLDAERERLWWSAQTIVVLALLVAALASWWLSGLAMRPLLAAYRQQEQFTADAAHELRAPLTNLLAVVDAHRSQPSADPIAHNQRLDQTLAVVTGQGQRLSRLISDLLLLARLDGPEAASAPQPCPLAQIARDLVEETSEAAAAAGVQLHLVGGADDFDVLGVEPDLYRLISNLLLNAIQYTPAGGEVVLRVRREGSHGLLQVQDSGIGITPADQRRIFDRFFRSDPGRSRRQGGTGLGLSIVAAIVRRHHGQISVASSFGSGSVFSVKLPIAG